MMCQLYKSNPIHNQDQNQCHGTRDPRRKLLGIYIASKIAEENVVDYDSDTKNPFE